MNKREAIKSLKAGKRVTHKYFLSGEYLCMMDDEIYTEDGYLITPEFWELRRQPAWDADWEIY
jgi:hypothetical protein